MYEQEAARAADMIEAIPEALKVYKCPICEKEAASLTELTHHYAVDHPDSIVPLVVTLHLNNRRCEVLIEPHWTLQQALQYRLGLTGTKHMCGKGVCGSCTVIMDNRSVLACMILAIECEHAQIQTIEGIAADPKWKPLVDAYCRWDAMQCGYCTPGFLVSAKALLDKNPHPTKSECYEALAGNICICGTYPRHAQAILEAALIMAEGGEAHA